MSGQTIHQRKAIASYRDIQNAKAIRFPINRAEPPQGSNFVLGLVLIACFVIGAVQINDGAKKAKTLSDAANACMAQGKSFYVAHVDDVDQVICTRTR